MLKVMKPKIFLFLPDSGHFHMPYEHLLRVYHEFIFLYVYGQGGSRTLMGASPTTFEAVASAGFATCPFE
jgi:hypothetical protein